MSTTPMDARPAGQAAIPTVRLVKAALVLVVLLQLPLVFHRAVNWDEFWHYSLTVLAANGTLDQPLQTLFTRFFMWVPGTFSNQIDDIILIRVFMLGCELVTLACIAKISARFSDKTSGLLCALAYLSAGFVFQHGTSFRFDPQATALLMTSLWILLCRPSSFPWMTIAGALGGIATLITIKSVLYAPAFAGVVWLRWSEQEHAPRYIVRLAVMLASAVLTFALAYFLHSAGIVAANGNGAGDIVSASTSKMFSLTHHPYWRHNLKGAALSPVLTILALVAPVAIAFSKRSSAERLALAGFWLPLTTLGFYHNTAPYYHVFMLAPVSVSLVAVVPAISRRYGAPAMAVVFVLLAGLLLSREGHSPINKQRELVSAADEIFGGPVSYFDSCAMLGRFRKANPFLTPWGVERYLRGELPTMTSALERQVVPLLVEDDPLLTQALRERDDTPGLLAQDLSTLRSTYIPFWGPFWVAGFELPAGSQEQVLKVRVPGPYTVRSSAPVIVDGRQIEPDTVIVIGRGNHRFAALADARVVWGRNLAVPARPAPSEPYFTAF